MAGRKEDPIKKHFDKGDYHAASKRYDWSCKYCNTKFLNAKPETLQKHTTTLCKSIGPEIRTQALELVAADVPDATLPQKRRASAAAAGGSVGSSSAAASRGGRQQLSLETGFSMGTPYTRDQNFQHDLLLLRWVVVCGVSFHAISSVFFQAYVQAVTNGRSRPAGGLVAFVCLAC
jgi:hypothetical protein